MMGKVTAPWWVSVWPTFGIILTIAYLLIAILFAVKAFKFMRLGIMVFNDYLEKNKKQDK